MKKYVILMAFSLLTGTIFAQGSADALRYSQVYYMGTARSMAMGGAFGALGADFSVASTNPAGMGLFNASEFSLSAYFSNTKVSANYFNTLSDGFQGSGGLSNIGYVFVRNLNNNNNGGWKTIQFAIGKNKTNDFNSYTNVQGFNPDNSRIDSYINTANGTNYNNLNNKFPYHIYPAWYLYLLDTIPGSPNQYTSPVPMGGIFQQSQHYRSGGVNEYYLSASANYNDLIYIGATLGFSSLNYQDDSYYTETFKTDSLVQPSTWEVDQSLQTVGTGINLKLGVIVRPTNWLRVGLAYHTPTYYALNDTWQTKTYANLPHYVNDSYTSDIGTYNYSLNTPSVFLGDVGFIIGKRGTISAEIENVNYTKMKLSASDYSFQTENSNIRQDYKSVTNFRLGTEWRLGIVDLRAGYAYYASPYANNLNDGKREIVSGGVGFNVGHLSLGLAALRSLQKQDYYPYTNLNQNQIQPVSNNTFRRSTLVFSLKYRFF